MLPGLASTGNGSTAGVASTLAAPSMARTRKRCAPLTSALVVDGETQAVHAPQSTRHSKVEPGTLESKLKVGVVSIVVPCGPVVRLICGSVSASAAGAAPSSDASNAPMAKEINRERRSMTDLPGASRETGGPHSGR